MPYSVVGEGRIAISHKRRLQKLSVMLYLSPAVANNVEYTLMFLIIHKYLVKQYLTNLLLVLLVVSGVLFVFDFVELTRIAVSKSIGLGDAAVFALQKNPMHIQKVLGFILLLASMLTYSRMARNSEMIILKTAGMSVYQYVVPLVLLGLLLGTVYVSMLNPLATLLSERYLKNEAAYIKGVPSLLSVSRTGLWIKQSDKRSTQSIVHALRVDPEKHQLQEVTFYFLDKDSSFSKRIDADTAELKNGFWFLPSARQASEGQMNQPMSSVTIPTTTSFEQIQESLGAPESFSFWKLPNFISIAENSGLAVNRYKLYFYRLLIMPLFFASIIVLGAAFSMSYSRFAKANKMMVALLLIGFLTYFITDVVSAFAISGQVPMWLGVWLPTVMVLAIGIFVILHLEEVKTGPV